MPFLIRPSRRVPVCCPVTYHCGDFEGLGTVWNLSLTGWRFSGDLPLRPGETVLLTATLPNEQRIEISEAVVRWANPHEYGIETKNLDRHTQARLEPISKSILRNHTVIHSLVRSRSPRPKIPFCWEY